jgi:hypothetical protein
MPLLGLQWYWWLIISLVLAAVATYIILVLTNVIDWDFSTGGTTTTEKKMTFTSSDLNTTNSRLMLRRQTQDVTSSCTLIDTTTAATYGLANNLVDSYMICYWTSVKEAVGQMGAINSHQDWEKVHAAFESVPHFYGGQNWKRYNEVFDATFNIPIGEIFQPRGESDIIVKLKYIQGTFYSIFLLLKDSHWGKGFDPGSENGEEPITATEMKAKLDAMREIQKEHGILLVGPNVLPPKTKTTTDLFDATKELTVSDVKDSELQTFRTDKNNEYQFNTIPANTTIPTELLETPARRNGTLWATLHSADFAFDLDGTEFKVRVLMSGDNGMMGMKQLYLDGKWQYLDGAADPNVFVGSRDDLSEAAEGMPYGFWNNRYIGTDAEQKYIDESIGYLDDNASATEIADAKDEAKVRFQQEKDREMGMMQAHMRTFAQYTGMPFKADSNIDWLKLKNSDVVVDIKADAYVGFMDAKTDGFTTEEQLKGNPVEILKRFEIQDMSLTVNLSFD